MKVNTDVCCWSQCRRVPPGPPELEDPMVLVLKHLRLLIFSHQIEHTHSFHSHVCIPVHVRTLPLTVTCVVFPCRLFFLNLSPVRLYSEFCGCFCHPTPVKPYEALCSGRGLGLLSPPEHLEVFRLLLWCSGPLSEEYVGSAAASV